MAGTVVILGAGFSKAISDQMPLLKELSKDVADGLGDAASEVPFLADDLELGLSYLAQSHPGLAESQRLRNIALFLEAAGVIAKVLQARMSLVLGKEKTCPEWLVKFAYWLHYKEATVVTLNYDTLLERAMTQVYVTERSDKQPVGLEPDQIYTIQFGAPSLVTIPSQAKTIRLLKLHGSINWFYSGRPGYYGEPIYLYPISGWSWDSADFPAGAQWNGRVPLIVPPVTEKTGYFQHESIRFLWSQAAASLKDASEVFCVGYSFPETDLTMRFLLHEAIPRQRTPIHVVNPDASVLERFRKLLPSTFDVNAAESGGTVQNLVDDLFRQKSVKDNSVLGHGQGPVEQRIRSQLKLLPHSGFHAVGSGQRFEVADLSLGGITLLLRGFIPAFVPWFALEKLHEIAKERHPDGLPLGWADSVKAIWDEPVTSVDALLKHWTPVAVAREIVTLLHKMGLLEPRAPDYRVYWTIPRM